MTKTKNIRRRNYQRIGPFGLGLFVTVFLFVFLAQRFGKLENDTSAANLANFDPGYIISDYQMTDYNSMSEADIQNFLWSKGRCYNTNFNGVGTRVDYFSDHTPPTTWHVKDGHTVCLAEENMNGETAAHIIWQAAQDYRINPKVLIVLLQKETGTITDPIPNSWDYQRATGYGCPDTAACSEKYYGFKNQVRNAASLFRIVMDGNSSYYPIGNNNVRYSPDPACGSSVVYIKNLATSALYRYTPYQPNAGALAAGYGTAPCGAYGNRNFYAYFEDWFGGVTEERDVIKESIDRVYIKWGDRLGTQIEPRDCSLGVEGACIQVHANGMIVYNKKYGAYEIYGEIYNRYKALDSYKGILGFPITGINCDDKLNCYQIYEGSTLLGDSNFKTWFSDASIAKKYITTSSILGAPVENAKCFVNNGKNACEQKYERGAIIYSAGNGAHEIYGEIYNRYKALDSYKGILGFPITGINCDDKLNCYQIYEGSTLLGDSNFKTWFSDASIAKKYITTSSILGAPVENAKCSNNVCSQRFQNGSLAR